MEAASSHCKDSAIGTLADTRFSVCMVSENLDQPHVQGWAHALVDCCGRSEDVSSLLAMAKAKQKDRATQVPLPEEFMSMMQFTGPICCNAAPHSSCHMRGCNGFQCAYCVCMGYHGQVASVYAPLSDCWPACCFFLMHHCGRLVGCVLFLVHHCGRLLFSSLLFSSLL